MVPPPLAPGPVLFSTEASKYFHVLFGLYAKLGVLSRLARHARLTPCVICLAGCVSDCFLLSAEVSCLELLQHKRLLLCGLTSGTVLIYPLALPQETLCIPPPESMCKVVCLASSPQEKHLAVAYEDCVRLFEVTTRDSFPTVEGPLQVFALSLLQGPLSSMALLSNHRLLYGTLCGEVTLWDLQAGVSSQLEPHRSRVTCVTASNWETHVLVGSEDAVQRVWSLNPLVLDHTMEYKVRGLQNLCFRAPHSKIVCDGNLYLWMTVYCC